jgi:hypothetical protein
VRVVSDSECWLHGMFVTPDVEDSARNISDLRKIL